MALSIMRGWSINAHCNLVLYHLNIKQKTKSKQWWPSLWISFCFEAFFSYNCCFTYSSGGRSRAVFVTLRILEGTVSTEVVIKKCSNAKDFYKLSFKPVKAKVRWGGGLLLLMDIGARGDIKVYFKTYNILQLSFKASSFPEPVVWVTWPRFYWLNFYSSPMNNLNYEL